MPHDDAYKNLLCTLMQMICRTEPAVLNLTKTPRPTSQNEKCVIQLTSSSIQTHLLITRILIQQLEAVKSTAFTFFL